MEQFSSTRWFSLHDYYPSFHLLLLRSRPETAAETSVIDIIFRGVYYVELRADFNGLTLSEATPDEIAHLDARAARPERYKDNRYFVLTSNDQRYFIGAYDYYIEENKLGLGETSLGATFTAPEEYERLMRLPAEP